MEKAILDFNKQFEWKPEVLGNVSPWKGEPIVVCGMGGSHLGAGLLKLHDPRLPIIVHRDYGLPAYPKPEESFLVASSYSGNTEETVDFLEKALGEGLKPSVIASGGKIFEIAEKNDLARVKMPADAIQPRMALGYSLLALSAVTGMDKVRAELGGYAGLLRPESSQEQGKILAGRFLKKTVLIYTSLKNKEISYNWKIKLNETGKVPAFANVFPELNHNEIMGYTKHAGTPEMPAIVLFIEDDMDHERNKKRMKITREILEEGGVETSVLSLYGKSPLERALNSLILADWTAYYIASHNGVDPVSVPMIEEFKKRMK